MTDVVYGRNPVREALRGRRTVHEVLVSERATGLDWLREASVRVVTDRALAAESGTDDHQGIVARVDPYPYVDADEVVAGDRALVVALDEVTDPHNVGAIARVAECAGATGLVLPRHRSATITPTVCKTSAGAVEHLAIAIVPNLADWLEHAKRPGLWVYAAAADASVDYDDADLTDGAIFVLGGEGRGLRPRVRSVCDQALRLPMYGQIGSLNVSVATALLLYEALRQRGP